MAGLVATWAREEEGEGPTEVAGKVVPSEARVMVGAQEVNMVVVEVEEEARREVARWEAAEQGMVRMVETVAVSLGKAAAWVGAVVFPVTMVQWEVV